MKIITYDDIKGLNIDPLVCIEWVSHIIKNKRQAILPPKISIHQSNNVFCNIMPCIIPSDSENSWGGGKSG